jgi:hypothetical protein
MYLTHCLNYLTGLIYRENEKMRVEKHRAQHVGHKCYCSPINSLRVFIIVNQSFITYRQPSLTINMLNSLSVLSVLSVLSQAAAQGHIAGLRGSPEHHGRELYRLANLFQNEEGNAPTASPTSESSTLSTCASPRPKTICYKLYQPVTCGPNACPYSNLCFAQASGYSYEDCDFSSLFPVETMPPSVVESSNDECPNPAEGVACILLYMPVMCTRDPMYTNCEYSNSCVADAAGFVSSEECTDVSM